MIAAGRKALAIGMAALLSASLGSGVTAAQDKDVVLWAEFPVDLEPPPSVAGFSGLVDPSYAARIPDGEAAMAILEEARWTFSGMIWGFDYIYTPSDEARKIAELFDIVPRSPAASAAMKMRAVSSRLAGTTVFVTVEHNPDPLARREMSSWKVVSSAPQGRGSAPMALGPPPAGAAAPSQVKARLEATTVAVREALRAYLRSVTHNKPREVRGTFAFASQPRLYVQDGSWIATVRIYARVDEIVSYGAY